MQLFQAWKLAGLTVVLCRNNTDTYKVTLYGLQALIRSAWCSNLQQHRRVFQPSRLKGTRPRVTNEKPLNDRPFPSYHWSNRRWYIGIVIAKHAPGWLRWWLGRRPCHQPPNSPQQRQRRFLYTEQAQYIYQLAPLLLCRSMYIAYALRTLFKGPFRGVSKVSEMRAYRFTKRTLQMN